MGGRGRGGSSRRVMEGQGRVDFHEVMSANGGIAQLS